MTSRNGLGKIIKQQRRAIPLTLQELARAIGVSSSHLGRIERGDRFPSARILHRIAKPLHFGEDELFVLAGYLSPRPFEEVERNIGGQLDSSVAAHFITRAGKDAACRRCKPRYLEDHS